MRVERIGKATLYCGDCLDILPEVPAFGHVVTDPPYMLKSSSDHKSKLNPWNDLCNGAVFVSQWLKLCADRMENGGALWSFCNWRGLPAFMKGGYMAGLDLKSLLVWDKGYPGPGHYLRSRYELIAFYAVGGYRIADRNAPDIRVEKWPAIKPHGHPAEKPEKLVDWLLTLFGADESVCDPFMGSGTVGVSALKAGRGFIGIEADEHWFDVACRRIEEAAREITDPAIPRLRQTESQEKQ